MSEKFSAAKRGAYSAAVCANKQIGERFYRLGLEFSGAGAEAFARLQAGQFAQLDVSSAALPPAETIPQELVDVSERKILLRRPFSFADVTTKDNNTIAEVLYCVVGPATLRMTTLSAGDSVSVIGPLGNGFRVPDGKKTALLVAGGMGAGPLQYLAKILTADYSDIEVIAFAGAKTAEELPFKRQLDKIAQQLEFSLPEFAKYGVQSLVATDDGSAGFAGLVTDCLLEWLGKSDLAGESTVIYSCGPEQMLARVAEIAKARNIDCQVSMERRMACGIGICQSCAVECKTDGPGESVYKMCCTDGPVFDSEEVVWCIR
ncbi:MAG TPA: dihydroorotate dehydrogenase electron transfer subunit [Sedimentisphaerales bacterium]|nr:dihydroorotate dehydrogenase electron transfer subunit [Sedimentisphaerales bacterium]